MICVGYDEAWLHRIDAAVGLLQEHYKAESACLYTVYDGGLAYTALSACGMGTEDLQRGVPYNLASDLTSSVAMLLASQVRSVGAILRASVPAAEPGVALAVSVPGGPLGPLPSDWHRLHLRHGLRHFIAMPMYSGDLTVGALMLAAREGALPPSNWQPEGLRILASALALLLQSCQLSIATSIMTDVHLARNMDELVRAVRRGVNDLVAATTYLTPSVRVALIRSDGSAAAVFEEPMHRRTSYSRLSVCSDTAGPTTAGVPEMLAPNTSRRSMDTGRLSAVQVPWAQPARERTTATNAVFSPSTTSIGPNGDPPCPSPGAVRISRKESFAGIPDPGGPSATSRGEGPAGGTAEWGLAHGSVSVSLNEGLTAVSAAAAGAMALGGASFSTHPQGNGSAAAGGTNKSGARGHGLSLGNTLLGEALQKECGLWISDCTLYLQEAKTFPRDIVVSRGSRAVHSIAVCSGRHNGVPLLGAYCVYGAVLPRQLLRAVTLELEQLLKLLAPSVCTRLCSPTLAEEWVYLHEEILNPARVDHLKRGPRLSASVPQPDGASGPPNAATSAAGAGGGAAAAAGGPGGFSLMAPPSPSHLGVALGVPARLATGSSMQFYVPGAPDTGVSRSPGVQAVVAAVAAASGAATCAAASGNPAGSGGDGQFLPSGVVLSSGRSSEANDGEGGAAAAAALVAAATAAATLGSSARRDPGFNPMLSTAQVLGMPTPPAMGGAAGTAAASIGAGVGSMMGSTGDNDPGDGHVMPRMIDGFGQRQHRRLRQLSCGHDSAGTPLYAAGTSGPQAAGATTSGSGSNAAGASGAAATQRPASYGSVGTGSTGGVVGITTTAAGLYGSQGLGSPSMVQGSFTVGTTGGSMSTNGSTMRTMLAAPSFTVESVRSTLGGGLCRAPLVSGLHEKLAAAQASRLVHGTAIEHQEELAAIDVLEKIGEGGYGEVYRGVFDGTEVAIKIVYEPQGAGHSSVLTRTACAAFPPVEEETVPGTTAVTRNLHDAFELTVSVSVCHPNIVQVLTFFTDVYVHIDRRSSVEMLPSTAALGVIPASQHPHPAGTQPNQQQPGSRLRDTQPDQGPQGSGCSKGCFSGLNGHANDVEGRQDSYNSPVHEFRAALAVAARGPQPSASSFGGAGSPSMGGGAPRVTLLPYPLTNLTSCQLATVDVSPVQYAEYSALQAAMASNGSAAQQVVARSPPALVICMEYCDAGSLTDAIVRGAFRQPSLNLYGSSQPNFKAIYVTLLEMALALRHLHSLRLVHCDLKPSNVLLRSSHRDPRGFTAKLSDFGLVRLMEPCGEGGRLAIPNGVTHGTVTHMAPEVLDSDQNVPHDSALDIYAFGIIMWQIVYGSRLYPGVSQSDIPPRVVTEGMRPRFISNVPPEYRKLAESCWSADPAARPTAAELVQSLKELMGLGPRVNSQRRYSALAPQRRLPGVPTHGSLRGGTAGGIHRPYLARLATFTAASDTGGALEGSESQQGTGPAAAATGNGDEATGQGATGMRSGPGPKSGGMRNRSVSYGGFPVHIL